MAAEARRGWSRREFATTAAGAVVGGIMMGDQSKADPTREPGTQSRDQSANLTRLSLAEASERVRTGKVSPVELTESCLDRVRKLDRTLNAFITVTAESARAQAKEAEAEVRRGRWRGPLHGIPIALKDLVDTAGVRTTSASALFKDRVPTEDAEIVRRLKAAGAVLLGKLNMHEFAYGGSSVISAFGPVRNPWAPDHSAGGSSAGSAVAVATGMCYAAIGSDTGGSIRQPAAYCGVVGLKPSFGRVSTHGVVPLSWSLDHVGPLTRTVEDAALMLQTLAAGDSKDATLAQLPVADCAATLDKQTRVRLGVPRSPFCEGLHPEIQKAFETALSILATLAASQRDLEIDTAPEASVRVLQAEAYAFHEESVARSPELYQPETLRRIRTGAAVSASAYIRARRTLDELRGAAGRTFETVDVLVTPTTPVPPFAISELLADLEALRAKEMLTLRNTRGFNCLGLPTVSLPCGFTSAGLPIGLQITGAPGAEALVLALAHAYEQATDWHKRWPDDRRLAAESVERG